MIILKPWETFMVISGHYGIVDGSSKIVVRSLRFVTNEATYGPFGREDGTPFCFSFQPGFSFSGFHGCSGGGYLQAIGVYISTGSDNHIEPEPDRRRTTPYHRSADKSTNYKVARIYYT
ncbi:hypothetical protein Taro_054903 [Colocasia esculenta]|uniref:Jacalin-type lectin domain-containing protein n=1 Tax=Colocasia esculenta TaxID=4460 RepID=A0A843XS19_COLES|nr:hypothetical protein [Colocasia esculenta]